MQGDGPAPSLRLGRDRQAGLRIDPANADHDRRGGTRGVRWNGGSDLEHAQHAVIEWTHVCDERGQAPDLDSRRR